MKTQKTIFLFLFLFSLLFSVQASDLFIEAESFSKKGGWVVDQQFMDLMGSSYLMAHGMGAPVKDAATVIEFSSTGRYYVYVRTYNWTSPWSKGDGAGKFKVIINEEELPVTLGATGYKWEWQKAGEVEIQKKQVEIRLQDLTGFNGRCDALYFTTAENRIPPDETEALASFRKVKLHLSEKPLEKGDYDLVVVGGGIAGMSAAISAARLGCRVALVNDRPVLGGNNSSEIRVHLGGRIGNKPYPELGGLQKEFGPSRGGNAQPKEYYEDDKKQAAIAAEKNITLFPSYRVFDVEKNGNSIRAVIAKHIETGEEIRLTAPLFSDCTGDGTIGFLAGADYSMGREGKSEYNEETAPQTGDKMTMGTSVQWYSIDTGKASFFPIFSYGVRFNDLNAEKVTMGEWTWETGMNYDQIKDFERIRDYGLMVVYSNWSYLKNDFMEDNRYKNRKLEWVAYVAGKRESRRLLGDHVLTENDIRNFVEYPDASAPTTWTIDLHYPDPENTKHFPDAEFKSIAKHIPVHPYPIPYRCLYSRNVDNLFMAGRNISVTHVALGTVRVMRTTGIMGEVVGMAASLCKKYQTTPRGIYREHLDDLKTLMRKGVAKKGLPDNQQYNQGSTLGDK
ncbi:MAG: FAD-dependent oxidoreductase [Bacteroidales bacterium]|nr:FAD-dependent oxidoreductase [Bacteroidales bacterium]